MTSNLPNVDNTQVIPSDSNYVKENSAKNVISAISNKPIIYGNSPLGKFVNIVETKTGLHLKKVVELNVKTGEAKIFNPETRGFEFKILDCDEYHLTFKNEK